MAPATSTKKPDSVDQMWWLFVTRVGLRAASDIQLREMEMAFKAGCAAVLIEMRAPVADLPEEAAIRTLIRWTQEINEFLTKRVQEYQRKDAR